MDKKRVKVKIKESYKVVCCHCNRPVTYTKGQIRDYRPIYKPTLLITYITCPYCRKVIELTRQ